MQRIDNTDANTVLESQGENRTAKICACSFEYLNLLYLICFHFILQYIFIIIIYIISLKLTKGYSKLKLKDNQ